MAVEEAGSEGAVIRASGRLSADGTPGPFEYVCYIHVYAGSPVVRVSFSYTDCQGAGAGDHVALDDLSLVLPTTLAGSQATVGGEGRNFTGQAAKIVAKTSDLSEITVDGAAAGMARGKTTKPLTTGWADLSAANSGVAVGVRWFWQMFPKAVEAKADGTLRVALWARENGKPLDVYMGQGRTHYLTFNFHGPTDAACSIACLYAETGDEKYRDAALGFLKVHTETRPKGFGQSWRSAAYAWYYLSDLPRKK